MTCASCAARIEKKLNRMDGVTATVNYATEKAKVDYAAAITHRRPRRHGRGDRLHGDAAAAAGRRDAGRRPSRRRAASRCASRLIAQHLLAVPVIALAMIPALQFDYWQWRR